MYSSTEVWIIAIVAVIVGSAVGFFINRYLNPLPRRGREFEEQLHALQEQHKNYRYDVNAHFNNTAELLGHLANSYREVHNHLARGAIDLCDPGAVKLLKLLPEQAPVLEEQLAAAIEPPRDYALRSPYDKGVLDEDFGLDKARGGAITEPPRYL
ncbi:MAG: hypothetical protein JWM78_1920 [Verrucomicrobiaceae bacterium]|nr:hypothetical protein [Verrucomicrobiaceae bacterium]